MAERLSDEILMSHLARGDRNAVGILYDRYYKQIFGYFVRMTKNAEISRDLTQNVFLKILKYSHNWKDDKVFAYWLFRIARNILIDYFKESRRYESAEEQQEILLKDETESVREMEIKS